MCIRDSISVDPGVTFVSIDPFPQSGYVSGCMHYRTCDDGRNYLVMTQRRDSSPFDCLSFSHFMYKWVGDGSRSYTLAEQYQHAHLGTPGDHTMPSDGGSFELDSTCCPQWKYSGYNSNTLGYNDNGNHQGRYCPPLDSPPPGATLPDRDSRSLAMAGRPRDA